MISECHFISLNFLGKPHQEYYSVKVCFGVQKLKKSGVLNFHILDITALHCTGGIYLKYSC
jgi:hypothetical protein